MTARPKAHILWEGTQLANHSFAVVNRQHCCNLLSWGAAELTLIPCEPDQIPWAGDAMLEQLMMHDIRNKGLNLRDRANRPHIWIRHTWPPKPKPPGRDKWVVIQPWEYSLFPQKHLEVIRGADEIWTPSRFSWQAFVDSGLAPSKVHVVPNGVDTAEFSPNGGRHFPLTTTKRFKFLYLGGTIYRKGVDLLLEAYTDCFSIADDVCLVIKDMGTSTLYRGQTAEDLVREHQGSKDAPEIIYLDRDLPQPALADLYRTCDVFVSPYRGEGFSLPTLEAMACGTPVIVTGGGSTDDFVDSKVGWTIDSTRVSIGDTIYGDPLPAEGFLLQPDMDHLKKLMAAAVETPAETKAKGERAAQHASANWTWRQASLKLLERIDILCGTNMIDAVLASETDGEP